jgi:hypothetical protein
LGQSPTPNGGKGVAHVACEFSDFRGVLVQTTERIGANDQHDAGDPERDTDMLSVRGWLLACPRRVVTNAISGGVAFRMAARLLSMYCSPHLINVNGTSH